MNTARLVYVPNYLLVGYYLKLSPTTVDEIRQSFFMNTLADLVKESKPGGVRQANPTSFQHAEILLGPPIMRRQLLIIIDCRLALY